MSNHPVLGGCYKLMSAHLFVTFPYSLTVYAGAHHKLHTKPSPKIYELMFDDSAVAAIVCYHYCMELWPKLCFRTRRLINDHMS